MSSAILYQSALLTRIGGLLTGNGSQENNLTPATKPTKYFEAKTTASALSKKHTAFDALASKIRKDPKYKKGLEEAGSWVAETFYSLDGDTVRTVRLKKGLSQKQLAEALGTSQPYIANLEAKGGNEIKLATCEKLSKVLGVSIDELSHMLKRQRELHKKKAQK